MKPRARSASRTTSIGAKIGLVVAIIVAGYAASTAIAAYQGKAQRARLATLSSAAVPAALEAQAALFAFEDAIAAHNNAMLTGEEADLDTMAQRLARASSLLDSLVKNQRVLAADISPTTAVLSDLKTLAAAGPAVFQAVTERGMSDATVVKQLDELRTLVEQLRTQLTALGSRQTGELSAALQSLEVNTQQQHRDRLIIFAIVIATGATMATLIIRRSIIRPVLERTAELDQQAFAISDAAQEFTRSSQALARGSSESAAALQNSSAALTQMASLTRANAERAESTKQVANGARLAADSGSQRMQELSGAMQAIQRSSQEISHIIETIDEIAFQTNILALNAAVEAARAGTAGAGFAVVADEVRSLAQRSAQAARETADKIEQATRRSNEGAQLSTHVVQDLDQIVQRVREVDELIAQITQASHEQNSGIGQITDAMGELDRLTQGNAAMAEQTSSAAHALGEQTHQLRGVSASFTRLVRGGSDAEASPAAPQVNGHIPLNAQSPAPTSVNGRSKTVRAVQPALN